jgi:hypothetical protein
MHASHDCPAAAESSFLGDMGKSNAGAYISAHALTAHALTVHALAANMMSKR